MNKSLFAAIALATALPMAVAHADGPGSYTVKLGDKTWTGTTATCTHPPAGPTLMQLQSDPAHPNAPHYAFANLENGVTLDDVTIFDDSNTPWQGVYSGGQQKGNATAVVNGKSYHITGSVLKQGASVAGSSDFEFDVTCP